MTAALYDIAKKEKLTENFDFQLNDNRVLGMLNLMRTNLVWTLFLPLLLLAYFLSST